MLSSTGVPFSKHSPPAISPFDHATGFLYNFSWILQDLYHDFFWKSRTNPIK